MMELSEQILQQHHSSHCCVAWFVFLFTELAVKQMLGWMDSVWYLHTHWSVPGEKVLVLSWHPQWVYLHKCFSSGKECSKDRPLSKAWGSRSSGSRTVSHQPEPVSPPPAREQGKMEDGSQAQWQSKFLDELIVMQQVQDQAGNMSQQVKVWIRSESAARVSHSPRKSTEVRQV